MYVPLEDEGLGDDALPEKPVQRWMHALTLLTGTAAAGLLCWTGYCMAPQQYHKEIRQQALLASIPVVALFFTWFHIWLAIQMMFLPINFFGVWQYRREGIGIGWQGVVPRKAKKMAKTAFACARPYLLGPRDWFGRVDARLLVAGARPHLERAVRGALDGVGQRHLRQFWGEQLPEGVREELLEAALESIQDSAPQLWSEFTELLCDEDIGIDNDGMIVTVFMENKELLNSFFQNMGKREMRFIEHCGAALGFVCGLVQLAAWKEMQGEARTWLLPGTGFFLGIVTNWLAIQMCFRPVIPHPVVVCGRHLFDIQGLFLKRQPEVCECYSKMLCDHFFNFTKVVAFLQTQPKLWNELTKVYFAHNDRVLRSTMGPVLARLAPLALGQRLYRELERDVQAELVGRIAEAHEMHKVVERHIAVSADIFRSNRDAMTAMPPEQFENLLHPVFQEDEWILILLGGVLGAIVGFAQVHFLAE